MNPRTPTKPTTPTDPAVPADSEGTGSAPDADVKDTEVRDGGLKDGGLKDTEVKDGGFTASESEASGSETSDVDDVDDLDDLDFEDSGKKPSGLGSAAAAVAAAALGVVALTGSWTGKVAAERETLIGQINTSSGSTAAQQISEIYGDAWHATALVNGLFALLALLVGIFALVRPAFGAPSPNPQPGWVRAVAAAGIALGVLGVVISAAMYFDLIVPLPTAVAAQ
ncbi:hypothetical protein ACFWOJ_03725 [Streptomyces sp. NPDC058439]|uniref:hypothetical protein n=1 Tax=Streptomyces sp. NPDC058439 TaxID=3346500 RepID=UPI00366549F3